MGTGMDMDELREVAKNRIAWRMLNMTVAKTVNYIVLSHELHIIKLAIGRVELRARFMLGIRPRAQYYSLLGG